MREHQKDHDRRRKVDRHQSADQGDDHAQQLVGQSEVETDVAVDREDQQKGQRELKCRHYDILVLSVGFDNLLSNFKYGCQHVYLPFRNYPSDDPVSCNICPIFRGSRCISRNKRKTRPRGRRS